MWYYIFYKIHKIKTSEIKMPNALLAKLVTKYGPVYYIFIGEDGPKVLSGEFKKG